IEKKTFEVTCDIDYQQVAYDAVSDGCWPLITNDRDMTGAEVLAAYRYQPNLERRHHLLKGIQDAAPVWIKTIPRIEAIFLPLHLTADQRADRTADPDGDEGRRDRPDPDLSRTARLRRPVRRPDLRDLRARHPARAPRRKRGARPGLRTRAHRAATEDPGATRYPRHRLREDHRALADRPLIPKKTEARSAEREL